MDKVAESLLSHGTVGLVAAVFLYLFIMRDRELAKARADHAAETIRLEKEHSSEIALCRKENSDELTKAIQDLAAERSARIADSVRYTDLALKTQEKIHNDVATLLEVTRYVTGQQVPTQPQPRPPSLPGPLR